LKHFLHALRPKQASGFGIEINGMNYPLIPENGCYFSSLPTSRFDQIKQNAEQQQQQQLY